MVTALVPVSPLHCCCLFRVFGLYFRFDVGEEPQMKTSSVVLLCCITMAALLAHAQGADDGYEMARVVAFERVAADAQHMANSDGYKISMQMGNILYSCRATASAAVFIDWTEGKEFPAKLTGKTMLVKNPNGQIVQLNVVGKKTPK